MYFVASALLPPLSIPHTLPPPPVFFLLFLSHLSLNSSSFCVPLSCLPLYLSSRLAPSLSLLFTFPVVSSTSWPLLTVFSASPFSSPLCLTLCFLLSILSSVSPSASRPQYLHVYLSPLCLILLSLPCPVSSLLPVSLPRLTHFVSYSLPLSRLSFKFFPPTPPPTLPRLCLYPSVLMPTSPSRILQPHSRGAFPSVYFPL